MTEPDSERADTADPQTRTARVRTDAAPTRPWWKRRAGVAAAFVGLAAIGLCWFGVNVLMSHPARHTPPQSPRTMAQVAGLPPGAASCPRIDTDIEERFNAGARGTPMTSCAFVEQVRKQYSEQNSPSAQQDQLSVFSPATSQWYDLVCLSSGDYVTCTGGAAAVVYLYHSSRPGSS